MNRGHMFNWIALNLPYSVTHIKTDACVLQVVWNVTFKVQIKNCLIRKGLICFVSFCRHKRVFFLLCFFFFTYLDFFPSWRLVVLLCTQYLPHLMNRILYNSGMIYDRDKMKIKLQSCYLILLKWRLLGGVKLNKYRNGRDFFFLSHHTLI